MMIKQIQQFPLSDVLLNLSFKRFFEMKTSYFFLQVFNNKKMLVELRNIVRSSMLRRHNPHNILSQIPNNTGRVAQFGLSLNVTFRESDPPRFSQSETECIPNKKHSTFNIFCQLIVRLVSRFFLSLSRFDCLRSTALVGRPRCAIKSATQQIVTGARDAATSHAPFWACLAFIAQLPHVVMFPEALGLKLKAMFHNIRASA